MNNQLNTSESNISRGIRPWIAEIEGPSWSFNSVWTRQAQRLQPKRGSDRRFKDELFSRLLDECEKTEGRVAIASTTVQLVLLPALDIRLSTNGLTTGSRQGSS